MSNPSRFFVTAVTLALTAFVLAGCGAKKPEGSMTVPRGSTITVRMSATLSTDSIREGSEFPAQLAIALTMGTTVFVPAQTRVDGVVDAIETDANGQRNVTVRLVRIHLPDGSSLELETNSISRSAAAATVTQNVDARTGIADKIRFLAETADPAEGDGPEAAETGVVLLPAGTALVFNLGAELVLPPPK